MTFHRATRKCASLLKKLGFNNVEAEDEASALSMLQANVMNLLSPALGIAQYDWRKLLKQFMQLAMSALCYVTTEARRREHIIAAAQRGASNILMKPFYRRQLGKIFEKLICEDATMMQPSVKPADSIQLAASCAHRRHGRMLRDNLQELGLDQTIFA